MARDLVGIGTLTFDGDEQPLRRKALAGLIMAVALPIPLVSASGLSLPLPGFVERVAVALADGVTSNGQQHSASPSRRVTIARTAAERALATRAAVTPALTPAPTHAAVQNSVARKSSVSVPPGHRSEHVVAPTRRNAVAPAAVVAPPSHVTEVSTPSVSPAVDPAPAATPAVTVSTDSRVIDVAVDPVPVVPVVPVVDPVPVVPVVPVDPGKSGSSNAGGNSGSGSSGHGNGGGNGGSDDSGGNSGKGKAGSNSGPG
jgi:uncharacterized membrane protein YgcG